MSVTYKGNSWKFRCGRCGKKDEFPGQEDEEEFIRIDAEASGEWPLASKLGKIVACKTCIVEVMRNWLRRYAKDGKAPMKVRRKKSRKKGRETSEQAEQTETAEDTPGAPEAGAGS